MLSFPANPSIEGCKIDIFAGLRPKLAYLTCVSQTLLKIDTAVRVEWRSLRE
jgi:hypothetical protein